MNKPKAALKSTRAVGLRPKGETRTGEAEIVRQEIVRNLKARLHALRAKREAVEAAIDAVRRLKAEYGSEIPSRYEARNCNLRMPAAREEEKLPTAARH